MTKLLFKTTINCAGCVSKVKPTLDSIKGISKWEVDTASPNKLLTIETEEVSPNEVSDALAKVGFKAEVLEEN